MKKVLMQIFVWGGVVMSTSINAQTFINPTLTDEFLDNVVTSNAGVQSSSYDDVTLNCDMLNDGQNNFIKAVAWDEGTTSNVTHLYFEDGQGHTATYRIAGVHPDIVLGDDRNNPGQVYRAAVIYIRSGGYVVMDFYRLVGLGTPSFTVNYVSTVPLSNTNIGPLYNTSMNPHIDMWSDANNRVNGYPGMYEFAVTWNESNNLFYNWGNIAAGTLNLSIGGARVNPSFAPNGRKYCDVACLYQRCNRTATCYFLYR